jgi:predicted  nucleic acid-binding Zn-ribbon protein
MGQAILGLLDTAANKAEADVQRASEAAQQLSSQLNAAQGRIAELEAEVRLFREKAERAEMWLTMISTEIEDRFINEPQKERRLH